MTDGSKIKFGDFYKVTGTKQYDTVVGGSSTVFVIEQIDADRFLKANVKRE